MAATKTYSSQLCALAMLSVALEERADRRHPAGAQALDERLCLPLNEFFELILKAGLGAATFGGAALLLDAGGTVLAQDEGTSTVWGMPGNVARAGLADVVLPLGRLGVDVALRTRRRG